MERMPNERIYPDSLHLWVMRNVMWLKDMEITGNEIKTY